MSPRKRRKLPDYVLLTREELEAEKNKSVAEALEHVSKLVRYVTDCFPERELQRSEVQKILRKVQSDAQAQETVPGNAGIVLSLDENPSPELVRAVQSYLNEEAQQPGTTRELDALRSMHEGLMKHERPSQLIKGMLRAIIHHKTQQE